MDALRSYRTSAVPPSARVRVLVVDDDPFTARVMVRALQRCGRASAVLDGLQALEALATEDPNDPYELILLDLCMPSMRGKELYEQLCRVAPPVAARVVIVTGGPACSEDAEFLDSFPNPIFYKPLHLDDLLRLVGERRRDETAA